MFDARADVVGSLLRPPELLEARRRYAEGRLSAAEFKRAEDRAVDGAIALQERAGLRVVTDGEMRRESFQAQMVEAVEGFGERTADAYLWGEWRGDEGSVGDKTVERPAGLGVVGKLERRRHLSAEEFVYARARTDRTVKVTLPSPSLYANFWSPDSRRRRTPPSTASSRTSPGSCARRSRSSRGWARPTCSSTRRTTRCSWSRRPARSTRGGGGTSSGG